MKKKTIFLIGIAVFLLFVVIGCIILVPKIKGYLPYYYDKNGKNQEDKPYTLTIEKTDFENEVAAELAENGIICSSARFLNYIKENYPNFVWYNGIYHLNANMSYKELCEALSEPDEKLDYVKFVVPEGKTVREIAKIVAESGLCTEEEFLAAADSYDYDYSFVNELKKRDQSLIGYKLEGYLFPATYEFRADTVTSHEIVNKMLKTFSEYITDEMFSKAGTLGLSLNEFITFGSVVQAEAFGKDSMVKVSSVFWNRLNSNDMRLLQSDPTTNYAQSLNDLERYSADMKRAYDTYSCIGLPVGPTNCPGIDVLNAVLAPEETDYFYFVTDKNGNFYFNKTLADHNRTIKSLVSQGLWA
ncbi:MAG: endolytic transglycosylase MltG [Clostridia bacterium]|nr:endolytic transglycosylase MltG [Clostridia bacterium]